MSRSDSALCVCARELWVPGLATERTDEGGKRGVEHAVITDDKNQERDSTYLWLHSVFIVKTERSASEKNVALLIRKEQAILSDDDLNWPRSS